MTTQQQIEQLKNVADFLKEAFDLKENETVKDIFEGIANATPWAKEIVNNAPWAKDLVSAAGETLPAARVTCRSGPRSTKPRTSNVLASMSFLLAHRCVISSKNAAAV